MNLGTKIKHAAMTFLFLTALLCLYESNLMNSIFVQSMCRKIYIPVVFWALIILYSILSHLVFFGAFNNILETIKKGIGLGFLIHIYTALVGLIILLARDHSFLSGYYFYYIKAVLLIFTFGISSVSAYLVKRLKNGVPRTSIYNVIFFSPLFIIPLYFIINLIGRLNIIFIASMCVFYSIPFIKDLSALVIGKISAVVKYISGKELHFIIFIYLLAFVIRCLFAVNIIYKTEAGGANNFILASDDGDTYDSLARSMAKDPASIISGKIRIWGGNYDEGYAVFLAPIYMVFGRNYYAVTLVQSLLGAATPVIIFYLGALLFSKEVGIFASLAMALKSPMIFLSVVLGHESIWIPLLALFALALTASYKNRINPYVAIAAAGMILGLICALRGLFVYFIPFAFLWILFLLPKKPISSVLRLAAVFAISVFIILYSVSAIFKNPLSMGSSGRFLNLWENERLYDQFKGLGNSNLKEIGVDFAQGAAVSLNNIAKDPVRFLNVATRIYPMRAIAYLEAYQFGYFDPIYLINSAKWPNNFMPTLEFYFTLFFIYGLILCFKKIDILRSPIFLILAFNIFVYAIIFCNMAPRYKDASTPFVYLIGSYGLVAILQTLKILKLT